jgi:hypothetical protein
MPEPGPSFFIDAEDDANVMHRRLAAVIKHYGVKFKDLIAGGFLDVARRPGRGAGDRIARRQDRHHAAL